MHSKSALFQMSMVILLLVGSLIVMPTLFQQPVTHAFTTTTTNRIFPTTRKVVSKTKTTTSQLSMTVPPTTTPLHDPDSSFDVFDFTTAATATDDPYSYSIDIEDDEDEVISESKNDDDDDKEWPVNTKKTATTKVALNTTHDGDEKIPTRDNSSSSIEDENSSDNSKKKVESLKPNAPTVASSVDYDAAARLSYDASGANGDFKVYKDEYLVKMSGMIAQKHQDKRKAEKEEQAEAARVVVEGEKARAAEAAATEQKAAREKAIARAAAERKADAEEAAAADEKKRLVEEAAGVARTKAAAEEEAREKAIARAAAEEAAGVARAKAAAEEEAREKAAADEEKRQAEEAAGVAQEKSAGVAWAKVAGFRAKAAEEEARAKAAEEEARANTNSTNSRHNNSNWDDASMEAHHAKYPNTSYFLHCDEDECDLDLDEEVLDGIASMLMEQSPTLRQLRDSVTAADIDDAVGGSSGSLLSMDDDDDDSEGMSDDQDSSVAYTPRPFSQQNDNDESDSNDDEMLRLKDEVFALQETGKSARQYYNTILTGSSAPFNLSALRAMATGGLTDEDMQLQRMNEYANKGWLPKKAIKISQQCLKNEITRRYEIECEVGDDPPQKRPALSGTIAMLQLKLARVSVNGMVNYPLKYDSERKWLMEKIDSTLNAVQAEKEEAEEANMRNGDHLRNETQMNNILVHGNDLYPSVSSQNTLVKNMLKLLESGDMADLSFQFSDCVCHAHRFVLAVNAPRMLQLFEDEDSIIPIENTSSDIFRHVLRYVYGGGPPEKAFVLEHALDIMDAADYYNVVGLKLEAEATLVASRSITVANVVEYILFADAKGCALLKEYAVSVFTARSKDVINSKSFMELAKSPELMKELMMSVVNYGEMPPMEGGVFRMMPVITLRKRLEEKGLDIDGSKEMLISRLESAD